MSSKVTQLLRYFLVDWTSTDVKTFFWSAMIILEGNRISTVVKTFFLVCTDIFTGK